MNCNSDDIATGFISGLILAFFLLLVLSMAYDSGVAKGKKLAMPVEDGAMKLRRPAANPNPALPEAEKK